MIKKKCYLVIGAVSSGTKIVSRIIEFHPDVYNCNAGLDSQLTDVFWENFSISDLPDERRIFLRRSYPHGTMEKYPDIQRGIDILSNRFNLYVVITIRDRTCLELSQERNHKRIVDSYKVYSRLCELDFWGCKFLLFDYEALVLLKELYVKILYSFLDLRVLDPFNFPEEIIDGNKKYITLF